MRELKLTGKNGEGKVALVDNVSFGFLNQWRWHLGGDGYVRRSINRKAAGKNAVFLHRVIIGAVPGDMVDHRNRDKLDNRRANLRFCSASQNNSNSRLSKHNSSGYRGVSPCPRSNKWLVYISADKKNHYLGSYDNKHRAAEVYNEASLKLRGPFAYINKIQEARVAR